MKITRRQLKEKHPDFKLLIDALWSQQPKLYSETVNDGGLGGAYTFLRNIFGENTRFAVAIGQGNELNGDFSIVLGASENTTNALKELIIGGYAEIVPGTGDVWELDDRLFVVGIGPDADNRKDGIRMYKSGLIQLANALAISVFSSDEMLPIDGAIQYINQRLELYFSENWRQLAFLSDIPADRWEVFIDFETVEAFTYTCPYALKFTSMQHQQPNAPALSVALDTNMAQYDDLVITPDAVGLVTLIGEKL